MNQIRSLRVITIADNMAYKPRLWGHWGLSFLLEFEDSRGRGHRILFDTGGSREAFLHNVREMEIPLDEVEGLVVSHGHLDHTAALVEAVGEGGGVRVYAHPYAFQPRFFENREGKRREVGVPEGEGVAEIEEAGGEILLAREPVEVAPGVWTTGEIPRESFETVPPPSERGRRIIVVDGEEREDVIWDDLSLWMDVEGLGPVVVTGCCHSGIVNTLNHVGGVGGFDGFYGVLGGLHLVGRDEGYIRRTLEAVKPFDLRMVSPCHCTGFRAMALFLEAFPEGFILNYSGRVIEVGETPRSRLL
ncbi:MAG: hypothetical protein AYL28_001000 [Candidatus Bathyarchaeota archaeon B23]|nr:MAG: hypothetical protein AYL28_001000 [Candidatus Bathyarchaeota archaeon B23]